MHFRIYNQNMYIVYGGIIFEFAINTICETEVGTNICVARPKFRCRFHRVLYSVLHVPGPACCVCVLSWQWLRCRQVCTHSMGMTGWMGKWTDERMNE